MSASDNLNIENTSSSSLFLSYTAESFAESVRVVVAWCSDLNVLKTNPIFKKQLLANCQIYLTNVLYIIRERDVVGVGSRDYTVLMGLSKITICVFRYDNGLKK